MSDKYDGAFVWGWLVPVALLVAMFLVMVRIESSLEERQHIFDQLKEKGVIQ